MPGGYVDCKNYLYLGSIYRYSYALACQNALVRDVWMGSCDPQSGTDHCYLTTTDSKAGDKIL